MDHSSFSQLGYSNVHFRCVMETTGTLIWTLQAVDEGKGGERRGEEVIVLVTSLLEGKLSLARFLQAFSMVVAGSSKIYG